MKLPIMADILALQGTFLRGMAFGLFLLGLESKAVFAYTWVDTNCQKLSSLAEGHWDGLPLPALSSAQQAEIQDLLPTPFSQRSPQEGSRQRFCIWNDSEDNARFYVGSFRPEIERGSAKVLMFDGSQKERGHWLEIPEESGFPYFQVFGFRNFSLKHYDGRWNFAEYVMPAESLLLGEIAADSRFTQSIPFTWIDKKSLFQLEKYSSILNYFLLGLSLAVCLLGVMMSVELKDLTFLFYGGTSLSIMLASIFYGGFLEFLFPNQRVWSFWDSLWIQALPSFFSNGFICLFLQQDRAPRRFLRSISWFILATTLVSAAVAMVNSTPMLSISQKKALLDINQSLGLLSILVACTALALWRSPGWKPFVMGWLCFVLCLTLWKAANAGLIAKSFMTGYLPLFGITLESVFATLALWYRVRHLTVTKKKLKREEAERERLTSVVQIVTHDLNNHLSLISSSLELSLRKKNLDPSLLRELERMRRATHMMASIMQRTRKLESFRLGKQNIEVKPCALLAILEEIDFLFSHRMQLQGIDFRLSLGPFAKELKDLDVKVWVDNILICHEVLANLVSNAIKFTASGGCISIELHELGERVAIDVRDNGKGIPTSLQTDLFSDHRQTSREGLSGEKGTGFGLPIARKMVEAMGGEIHLYHSQCQAPSGTCFRILLRKASAAEKEAHHSLSA